MKQSQNTFLYVFFEKAVPLLAVRLLEGEEAREVGGPDAGPTVLNRPVGGGELAQVGAHHLRLDFHLAEALAVVDAPPMLRTISGRTIMTLRCSSTTSGFSWAAPRSRSCAAALTGSRLPPQAGSAASQPRSPAAPQPRGPSCWQDLAKQVVELHAKVGELAEGRLLLLILFLGCWLFLLNFRYPLYFRDILLAKSLEKQNQ